MKTLLFSTPFFLALLAAFLFGSRVAIRALIYAVCALVILINSVDGDVHAKSLIFKALLWITLPMVLLAECYRWLRNRATSIRKTSHG